MELKQFDLEESDNEDDPPSNYPKIMRQKQFVPEELDNEDDPPFDDAKIMGQFDPEESDKRIRSSFP